MTQRVRIADRLKTQPAEQLVTMAGAGIDVRLDRDSDAGPAEVLKSAQMPLKTPRISPISICINSC